MYIVLSYHHFTFYNTEDHTPLDQEIIQYKLPATPLPSITDTLRTLGNNLFVFSPIHPKKSKRDIRDKIKIKDKQPSRIKIKSSRILLNQI